MSKRGVTNLQTSAHGNQRSKGHEVDVAKSKARKNYRYTRREIVPAEEEPKFKSVVSGLGGGKCFAVKNGTLTEEEGAVWEEKLADAKLEWSWYHQKQKAKRKTGVKEVWKVRKLKDRTQRSPTDKTGRKDTDVERETIDLRPDHSRAVQYFLEAGKLSDVTSALSEIRAKKIQLFEAIYGRRVLFVGEHDDAGQHHDDLWHSGTSEHETEKVRGLPLRTRNPFRSYGVSVGAASWARHFSAARDFGVDESVLKELAGPTMETLTEDVAAAKTQNGEDPRDLRLLSELDNFVAQRLMEIDPGIVKKANREYWDWIQENYRAGKIGVKRSREEVLEEKVTVLESERSDLKRVLNPVAEESLADAATRAVAHADGLAAKLKEIVAQSDRLSEEGTELRSELDRFKNQTDQTTGLLSKILTMLGIESDADIAPAVQRVVGEANQVPDLKNRIGVLESDLEVAKKHVQSLEKEITPLRTLKNAVVEFLRAMMQNPSKLSDNLITMLKEIGELAGEVFEVKRTKRQQQSGPGDIG